jgi:hypothetical protein
VAPEAVVIDTSNYYPSRDGAIAEVDGGKPESIWSQEQIGRPVVKAWNAVLAATLEAGGRPAGTPGRLAIPVAGDDATATATARQLVDQTGFDALDAGGLQDSWRQQPGTPAYCTELTIGELKLAVEAAKRERAPRNRDEGVCIGRRRADARANRGAKPECYRIDQRGRAIFPSIRKRHSSYRSSPLLTAPAK